MLHVAKLTGKKVAMSRHRPDGWIDDIFDFQITRLDDVEREICPCYTHGEGRTIAYESSTRMLSKSADLRDKSILLCGYHHSRNYTFGVEAELRRYLRPHANLLNAIYSYFDEIFPKRWSEYRTVGYERVAIHVRAGDYVNNPHYVSVGYVIPETPYFEIAMSYVVRNTTVSYALQRGRRIQFIVASESIEWCRETLNLSSIADSLRSPTVDVELTFMVNKSAQFALLMLTKCDKLIITAGSYGWWGAWLANKTTIYYNNTWLPGTALGRDFEHRDYYPPEWTPVGGPWFKF